MALNRSVVFKVGTLVQHSGGRVIPSPPTALPNVIPAFMQDTVDATNRYFAIGWNAGGVFTAVTDVEARAVEAFTVTHWNVRISAALGVGETLTARFVVNGTPDASLVISLGSGDSVGSATGSLAIAADDLVCVEFIVGGTLVSALVRGAMIVVES